MAREMSHVQRDRDLHVVAGSQRWLPCPEKFAFMCRSGVDLKSVFATTTEMGLKKRTSTVKLYEISVDVTSAALLL